MKMPAGTLDAIRALVYIETVMTRLAYDSMTMQRAACNRTWTHRIRTGLSLVCVSFAKGDPS